MARSLSGKSWIFIRIGGKSRFDPYAEAKLAARIIRAPREILVKNYYQTMLKAVFAARKLMREIIISSETETGRKRAAKGGKGPGRVKSGDMLDAVWARVVKEGDNKYVGEVGWLLARPGYPVFQEHGTRTGITAMNALQKAKDYVAREMRDAGRGGFKSSNNVQWDWDSMP